MSGALPATRPVTSWQEAERTAAMWMRWLGHPDAKTTAAGADGGIDVWSETALGQVKYLNRPVGRPDLQRLLGAAANSNKTLYFFSSAGFTAQAVDWAESVEIACFGLTPRGAIQPLSSAAKTTFREAHAANGAGRWVDPAEQAIVEGWCTRIEVAFWVVVLVIGIAHFHDDLSLWVSLLALGIAGAAGDGIKRLLRSLL